MAEKPNPFLLPSQQVLTRESPEAQAMRQAGLSQDFNVPFGGRGIDDLNRMDKQAQGLQFMERMNPMMGYDQSLQRQQDAERQNRLNAVRAGVGQEFPGMKAEDLMGMSVGALEEMRAGFGRRLQPDRGFTSRGPITPPANTGGDPRAVSSYPHLNRNMMRDRSGAVRLPDDVTSGEQGTVAARDSASGPKSTQGSVYYSPESGYRPGEMEPVDPILYEALPTPRTPAQLAESARVKAGSGQPLDAEERQWFSSSIRKQMQDAGKTEEEIQRALSRIDPATGMIPPRIR